MTQQSHTQVYSQEKVKYMLTQKKCVYKYKWSYTNTIHSSIIHDSPQIETTQKSINW